MAYFNVDGSASSRYLVVKTEGAYPYGKFTRNGTIELVSTLPDTHICTCSCSGVGLGVIHR